MIRTIGPEPGGGAGVAGFCVPVAGCAGVAGAAAAGAWAARVGDERANARKAAPKEPANFNAICSAASGRWPTVGLTTLQNGQIMNLTAISRQSVST